MLLSVEYYHYNDQISECIQAFYANIDKSVIYPKCNKHYLNYVRRVLTKVFDVNYCPGFFKHRELVGKVEKDSLFSSVLLMIYSIPKVLWMRRTVRGKQRSIALEV